MSVLRLRLLLFLKVIVFFYDFLITTGEKLLALQQLTFK